MQLEIILLCVVGGYLWGSISIARIVTRIVAPDQKLTEVELPDPNTGGTFTLKTVGATTASMILGPKYGGLIGILDIFKSAIPALILRLIFPDQPYFLFLGTAIVIGHIYPLYFGFRGGGGLSPALGTLLVLDPLGVLVSLILAFVIGMMILKSIELAVLGPPFLFVIWIAIFSGDWVHIVFSIVLVLLLILATIPDLMVNMRARKAGKSDLYNTMDIIPMGKMMKKMMERIGLEPKSKK